MTEDLQLFMLWNNGRRLEKQILADIGNHFEIIGCCEVCWPPEHFAQNLARFYGKNLRKGAKKIKECGMGAFLVIIVRDSAPQYHNGKNINMSGHKYQYRQMFGGGYMVHASDSQAEAFEHFLMLSGQDIADFAADAPSKVKTIGNLIGAAPWSNLDEIRAVLNKIPNCHLNSSEDVWLLQTPNPNFISRLLNAHKCWFGKNLFRLSIGDKKQKIRIISAA